MKRISLVLFLALLATVARGETQSLEKIKQGISANMHANYQACNEENMDKLLACMSDEMPDPHPFVQTVQDLWDECDTYNRLDDVKVLRRCDVPHANCRYPYATALITQTVIKVNNGKGEHVRESCENGKCPTDNRLRNLFGVDTDAETTRILMLFKHEDGEWKLIAGITEPEPVTKPGAKQPRRPQVAQQSVFN